MSKIFILLRPRLLSFFNNYRLGKSNKSWIRLFMFGSIGIFFWIGTFIIFYRVLLYFQGVQDFGDILAMKLLSMIIITFFALLMFSSIINSLSHFYLSQDLPLLHSLPVETRTIFLSRFLLSTFDSSWMVVAFSLPVFLSYGLIYQSGIAYYLIALIAVIVMCLISTAISSIIVMIGAIALPAGKIRTLFVILGVGLAILLVVLMRMIRPEQLVNPDSFASVVIYLNSLQTPNSSFLPTTWITDIITSSINGNMKTSLFNLALATSCAFTLIFLNESLARVAYFHGFSQAQTTPKRLFKPLKFNGWNWEHLLNFLSRQAKAFAVKEIRSFFRDSTQWPQLFLIGALIVVYLYNFSVLPLDRSPIKTVYLQNVFSFLNMGLAAFVLSAIAARFVYPAVSMEGEAFWIIQAAPVSVKTFLWIKFFLYYIPLLIMSEILIIVSNLLLGVTPFMMILSVTTIFCLVPAVVAMAIGLGAVYPDFKSENPALSVTSFGGLLFMLCCFGLIILVIILEAGPVYYIFMSMMRGQSLSVLQITWTVISFALVTFLCTLATLYPMRMGEKSLQVK